MIVFAQLLTADKLQILFWDFLETRAVCTKKNWVMHRILNFDEPIIAQFQNGTDMKM